MAQLISAIRKFKKFLPYIGISAIFFLLILICVFLFNYYVPNSPAISLKINPYYLLVRWDSIHYLNIILQGYTSPSVFFPLYPLVVSWFSLFFPAIFSGFLVSFLALSFALYYLNKLFKLNDDSEISTRSLLLLLVFPTALFFSLIYTEALFLALSAAFFYYAQRKQWLTAVIIGFFATLTRNIGIFLWPIYLIYIFSSLYSSNSSIYKNFFQKINNLIQKKEFWYSFIIPAGLLTFCTYNYFQFGNFLAFLSGQKDWSASRSFVWPWQSLYYYFRAIFVVPFSEVGVFNFLRIVIIEGGSFLLLLVATIYWTIKKNWPFSIYCFLNLLLFSCMFPMSSVNRYIVVIFPIFIFLAHITKKRDWLFYSLLALFFIFFVFNIYLFSQGAWVA